MTDSALAKVDQGVPGRRVPSGDRKQSEPRRIDAPSAKRRTCLHSGEGKRIFKRCFYSFQSSMYFASQLGRGKLPHEQIEKIEDQVQRQVEEAANELNQAIDGAELLLKSNNIDYVATYDTPPVEDQVPVTSALGRRYFELIHKLDQVMPLLQTLEIEEVITQRQLEVQRSRLKRIVLHISTSARNLAEGVRRRMNEFDARRSQGENEYPAGQVRAPLTSSRPDPQRMIVAQGAAVTTEPEAVDPITTTEVEADIDRFAEQASGRD